MKEGRLDPQKVKIEGIDTDEEIAEKEVSRILKNSSLLVILNGNFPVSTQRQRQIRLQDQQRKQKELALSRKLEERRRWWEGVDIMRPMESIASGGNGNSSSDVAESEEAERARTGRELQYSANYSRWDQWVPSDPASKLEVSETNRQTDCTYI